MSVSPCFSIGLRLSEIPDGRKEFAHFNAERLGDADEICSGKIALASLDTAIVCSINVRR